MARRKKLSIGTTVFYAVTGALLAASMALGFKIVSPGGDGYKQAALDQGQRVEVFLNSSEVEGKLLQRKEVLPQGQPPAEIAKTEEPEKAEKEAEHAAEQPEPAQEQHAATPSPAPAEPAPAQTPTAETPAPTPDPAATETETTTETATPEQVDPLNPVEKRLPDGSIIPIAGEQNAWQFYAKPRENIGESTPRIALVISGLGLAERATQAAVALPDTVTLSFSSYGALTAGWSQVARQKGHELLLDLPVQTRKYPAADPGTDGLLLALSPQEMAERFTHVLTKARGYVGLTMPRDDSLSEDEKIMQLLALFRQHGLLMVNSYPQQTAAMFQATQKTGVPILQTQVLLDTQLDETEIKNRLARAEDLSRRYGQILVIGNAYPLTLGLVDSWLQTLPQKGIAIVPVSALVNMPPKPVSPQAAAPKPAAEQTVEKPVEAAPAPTTTPAPTPASALAPTSTPTASPASKPAAHPAPASPAAAKPVEAHTP